MHSVATTFPHPWAAVGRRNPKTLQGSPQRSAFHGTAVVCMQDAGPADSFLPHSILHQLCSELGLFVAMHFPSHDLATVDVDDQVQVVKGPGDGSAQIGDVPSPDLSWLTGRMARGLGVMNWRARTAAMTESPMGT